MNTQYTFGLRFRRDTELEGCGTLLFEFMADASRLTGIVRRLMTDVSHRHPAALFDGIILYNTNDA